MYHSTFGLAGILGRTYDSALMSASQSMAGLFSTVATIVSASISPIECGCCVTDDCDFENISLD